MRIPLETWGRIVLTGMITGIYLSGCAAAMAPIPALTGTLPTGSEALPTASEPFFQGEASPSLPTPAEATVRLSATPTDTLLPTETPMEISAERPTLTPREFHYVFPLQPASAAGFIEGTQAHGYPATDIFAVMGTRFVAVTDGVVDFVSNEDTWDPQMDDPATRGGLAVAIIGRDGVRYYGSHLSAIAAGIREGVEVKSGQTLGQVGNSGDARNTLPHVHFGISRPTTPEDWKTRRGQVDPFPFLEAWRDGHDVTPPLP